MIAISQLSDIISQHEDLGGPMMEYLLSRFQILYHNYRSFGPVPMERFSLSGFGEILVAESYQEVERMIFEDMKSIQLADGIIYMGTYLKNNEICCDVIIPQDILTQEQRERLEAEL